MGALKKLKDTFANSVEMCVCAKTAIKKVGKELGEEIDRKELELKIASLSSLDMAAEFMEIFEKISEEWIEPQHKTFCECARDTIRELEAGSEAEVLLLAWKLTYMNMHRIR